MTLKQLQQQRLELAAEVHDLEARIKALRHRLVDVCDEIERLRAIHQVPESSRRANRSHR